ncbi:Rhomboid protease AarA [Providencia stuartii]|nr:Rhomboid protease AarA [Providencia stuartii]
MARHLAFNCLALFVIGIGCERAYGKFKLLAIYIISQASARPYLVHIGNITKISNSDLWTDSTVYITIGVGAFWRDYGNCSSLSDIFNQSGYQ